MVLKKDVKKMKHIKNNESGRSMAEVLTILAIIGVLSVGAFIAYILAINKYYTNEILDGAIKRVMTASTQLMMGAPINLDEYTEHNDMGKGIFSEAKEGADGNLGIIIDDVDQEICKSLIRSIGDKGYLLRVTTQADMMTPIMVENCSENEDDNDLILVYDRNLANKTKSGNKGANSGNNENPLEEPTKDPSCSAYPGTDPSYEGGVAGKADDNSTDCKCPEYNEWNTTDGKCVDNRPIYTTTSESKSHYNWIDNINCPPGYHWASLSEVRSDFNCSHNGKGYECDPFDFNGWLTDCLNSGAFTSCESAYQAAYAGGTDFFTSKNRGNIYYAICRRN